MHIGIYITVNNADTMQERTYSYEVDFADKTPMDQLEGHVKTMLSILDKQAHDSLAGDEDDEETA